MQRQGFHWWNVYDAFVVVVSLVAFGPAKLPTNVPSQPPFLHEFDRHCMGEETY
jgi:Sec-independent protein translocase protein TatA